MFFNTINITHTHTHTYIHIKHKHTDTHTRPHVVYYDTNKIQTAVCAYYSENTNVTRAKGIIHTYIIAISPVLVISLPAVNIIQLHPVIHSATNRLKLKAKYTG